MQNLISKKEEEERRLKALAEYRILGTKPESCYDDITKIAATTCNCLLYTSPSPRDDR